MSTLCIEKYVDILYNVEQVDILINPKRKREKPQKGKKGMVKVIGYRKMKGSFTNDSKEEIVYNNIYLHTVTDENPDVQGMAVQDPIKIKADKLLEIFRGNLSLENIIGREIVLQYYVSGNRPVLTGIHPVNAEPSGKR